MRDLLFGARIVDAAERAGATVRTIAAPAELPPVSDVELLLVDWNDREADWGPQLAAWRPAGGGGTPRLVLFGSHTDVDAHAEAKRHGIGPVMARSRFVEILPRLFAA
ncbi:MAG: hypothetical protein ABR509_01020 [Candidatus Limnocylindria bacterium]